MINQAIINSGINEKAVIESLLLPGSEDATFLMNEVSNYGGKSNYLCIGSSTYGGHHNSKFDFDEDMLLWGTNILWEFIKYVSNDKVL